VKPLVGIKRDFNYLKKELFSSEPISPVVPVKKPRKVAEEPSDVSAAGHHHFAFFRQKTPTAKTLFNKILHNHKQKKLVETFLKARIEPKVSEDINNRSVHDSNSPYFMFNRPSHWF